MEHLLSSLLGRFTYVAILAVLCAAGLGAPISEDLVLLLGGAFAARGITDFWPSLAVGYGGVILGEVTWALNYWPLTGWTGGALLLIAFYLVAGLILAQVGEGLRRRDLLEYGAVAALAFAIVALSLR